MADRPEDKSALDKIIMGAIIGTAIGSAIGVTFAPKKGEESRKIVKETVKGAAKGALHLAEDAVHLAGDAVHVAKDSANLAADSGAGVFRLARVIWRRILGKKPLPALNPERMKELPNEMEIVPPSKNPRKNSL